MSHRRIAAVAAFLTLTLALGVSAEIAWVGSRGGSTVAVVDTALNTEIVASPVGAGPIDLASDRPDSEGPFKVWCANSGSNTVTVLGVAPVGPAATVTGGGLYGTFSTPSGIARMSLGTSDAAMVLTDQKVTTGQTLNGRSTLRILSPVTYSVVDDFRDPSPSARYNDVLWTEETGSAAGRLWIADDGDGGVTVVRLRSLPPFGLPDTLHFQGPYDFADFIYDATSATLKAPRRLSTGSGRVVVADGGSGTVTILDAQYPFNQETRAVLANVVLPASAGTCVDVEVVGSFAYVTTTATAAANFFRINLTTFALDPASATVAPSAGGIGSTFDQTRVYVGSATSGAVTTFNLTAAWPTTVASPTFTSTMLNPFPWYVSNANASPPSAPVSGTPGSGGPTFISNATGSSSGSSDGCGLLGIEALVVIAFLGLRRRP